MGGGFFWGPEHITPIKQSGVCMLKELPRAKNCVFIGYIPSFLVIFCWGVSQFGLTIAPRFGRSDGKPVTPRSNR